MTLRTVLAAAAVLLMSSPALAQEAGQPAQPQPTASQLAFAQTGEAFDARMQTMIGDIQAMLADSNTDGAQKRAALETILASYTPEINTFAGQLQSFLQAEQANTSDPAQQARIAQALQNGPAAVRAIPDQVRQGVNEAIAQAEAQAAAQASGQAGASGQGAVAGSIPQQ